MSILDRERYWAFLKAYFICLTALVGLYVVIDAFTNYDEFLKRADGPIEMFQVMGRFYLVKITAIYDTLCGVITMMAAIFTVTWMQKNNELLAMLAAGISTQRVIRPVLISSILVSGLAIANQELIMPPLAEELLKTHDDDGTRQVKVYSRYDANKILFHAESADRGSQTVNRVGVTFPVEIFGAIREMSAKQAQYIPASSRRYPLHGGWLLRGARFAQEIDEESLKESPIVHLTFDLRLMPSVNNLSDLPTEGKNQIILADVQNVLHFRVFALDGSTVGDADENHLPGEARAIAELKTQLGRLWAKSELSQSDKESVVAAVTKILGHSVHLATSKGFPPPFGNVADLGHEAYFLRTGLSFQAITRDRLWYQFATTVDLIQGLSDPANEPEKLDIAVFLHGRILRPCLAVALLCLSLPLVLGGYGRNMFINLGLSLGTSAIFYGLVIMSQQLGKHELISPEQSAWFPLVGFGSIAMARWGAIRT
jgi:lipopolysaccharide export LptBFGC system permease protein LptF